MKKLFVCFTLVLAALRSQAALPQPDLIAQIHFAGAQKIADDPGFSAFTNEFASAEARALLSQTLDRLAVFPGTYFKSKLAPGAGDGVVQLRPLLDDLSSAEWFFEARDLTSGTPEYALAIRLDDARAQLWQHNLQQLLEAWTKIPVQKIPSGWELKKHDAPNLIRVTANDGWLLVDCGQNQLSLGEKILGDQVHLAADTNWLTADVNWPWLAQTFSALKELDLPETKLALSAADKNLHLNGNLFFPKNLPPNLPDWRLPTNTIAQPFVSFTAVRGFAAWLASRSWLQSYHLSPPPDQFFSWSVPGAPMASYAAIPVTDSPAVLARLQAQLLPILDLQNSSGGFFSPVKTELKDGELHLTGVPFASPFAQAIREPAGQFLVFGAFPNMTGDKPLPPELFQHLAQKNLVFYHWEVTAERFSQLLNLTQLALVITNHRQLEVGSPGLKWLQKIAPKLGNTVTEITQTAPDELDFKRSAPGGLTALEFLALANWLQAPNFPGCDLKTPSASGQ